MAHIGSKLLSGNGNITAGMCSREKELKMACSGGGRRPITPLIHTPSKSSAKTHHFHPRIMEYVSHSAEFKNAVLNSRSPGGIVSPIRASHKTPTSPQIMSNNLRVPAAPPPVAPVFGVTEVDQSKQRITRASWIVYVDGCKCNGVVDDILYKTFNTLLIERQQLLNEKRTTLYKEDCLPAESITTLIKYVYIIYARCLKCMNVMCLLM